MPLQWTNTPLYCKSILKVFTELTADECQDYPTLKAVLLNAYAVVPEVYRKRFRVLHKAHSETYSEFAFRLYTQFCRWLESEDAFSDIERLRELFQLEEFQSKLDSDLRVWRSIRSLEQYLKLQGLLTSTWLCVRLTEVRSHLMET